MDKINIYIPQKLKQDLNNDARMFEIYKKRANESKSVNMNLFLSLLINGYYKDYISEIKSIQKVIINSLDNTSLSSSEKEQITTTILKQLRDSTISLSKKDYNSKISLKPREDTEFIINQILTDQNNQESISRTFTNIFMHYMNKPFSQRETIIFKKSFDKLQDACQQRRSIIFNTTRDEKTIHEVIPYRIEKSSEELYNYLLCAETDSQTGEQLAMSYHLCRLCNIDFSEHYQTITDKVKNHLDLMTNFAPQYMINDDEETCVKLSDSGLNVFEKSYHDRPEPYLTDTKDGYHYYHFMNSKDQLYFYFRKFNGYDAEIIYPQSLKDQIIKFHKDSLQAYTGFHTTK